MKTDTFQVLSSDVAMKIQVGTDDRRFTTITEATSLKNINAIYGKSGASVEVTDLPSGGKMVSGSTDALREYISRDIEATEELRKRGEIEHVITEALFMQARGRAAPVPRPTYLHFAIDAICEDWITWYEWSKK